MATFYVDEFGNIHTQQERKKKKKNAKVTYTVDLDGNVSRVDDDDDIAPVKPTVKKREEDDRALDFFQTSKAFDDGWQVGDITKTILGTVGDAGLEIVKGAGSLVEGVTDAIGYGVAGITDVLGADEFAERTRKRAMENKIEKWTENIDNRFEQNSILGRTADSILQGVGQVGGIVATGGIAGAAAGGAAAGSAAIGAATAATTGLMAVSGFGSGASEAYKAGATDQEAMTYGMISGAADALTELLFGGLGKAVGAIGLSKGLSSADDLLAKKVSGLFANQITKNFAEFGIKAGAEGFEEVLAGTAQAIGKKITYMKEEELSEILADENLLEQFVVGAATSGMIQSGLIPGTSEGSLKESNATGRDFISGYTQNEQRVIDREVSKRVTEQQKGGKKLSKKEIGKIEKMVQEDMDKGFISIDTIEEVLGGETYSNYKKLADAEDTMQREFDDLGKKTTSTLADQSRYKELDERLKYVREKGAKSELRKRLDDEVSGMVTGSRLAESFAERSRRGQAFEADVTKYSEKQRAIVQKAVDSGILNNTRRTHEFVDMVARIAADRGLSFDFTNNAKLKESGFAVEGKTVNGFVTKDGITVNIQSAKSLNSVVGHEITHVLEGTELYAELQKAVFQYAETKKDLAGRRGTLTALYQGVEGANIDAELTADLVGDYLFTDADFINNLSTNHRNVFQKIYDEVKYLLKVATAGSKEARQLEKVKRAFEKAYREGGNNKTAENGGVKYSFGVSQQDIDNYVDAAYKGENDSDYKKYAEVSDRLLDDVADEIDLTGYAHALRDNDIRHIRNSHGENTTEKYPVTSDDIKSIPWIVENYDKVFVVRRDAKRVGVIYVKAAENGLVYYLEQVTSTYGSEPLLVNKQMIKTGREDIPHLPGLKDAIKKKQSEAEFLDDLKKVPEVYVQDVHQTRSVKSVPNSEENFNTEYSENNSGKKLREVGLEVDTKTETVSYSLSSLEDAFDYNKSEADYLASREEYATALAKSIAEDKGNPTAEERAKADRYLDSLFLIHDMIAADRDRLDYEAAVNRSAWVSNVEYGGSIDFSTLCAKRRLFTGTFDAIQMALPDTVLTDTDFLAIRNMLLEKGLESPCSMCYVEGSRAKHGVYVKKFLKEYLKTDPEWKPRIADFTSTTMLERTRIEHPEAYAAYQKAMNALSQRKPKEASVRTDYMGEILREFGNDDDVTEKNKNGGVRFNSFSDFEIIHTLDAMQVITDMARVGLHGQAYTKVKEFAEAFGNTGLKINLSLVAKDVDADGRLVFDETNGMKYAEAMDIRNRYSENVGTVIVVFNDAQLKAAVADGSIDYVLPFHRSQWKKSQYTMMGLPTSTRDYTNIQNDRYKNPTTGRAKKAPKGNIMPNEYWDFNLSGRENAQKYLDYINENDYIPKFDFLLSRDADGKWVLPEGAVGDGYFKLLIDFKMYDNDGWGAPQKPVVPEFNMPYIQQMLNDYTGGHQAFPVAHDVVDAFVAGKKSGQFSLSEEGDIAPTFGNYNVRGEDIALESAEDIATVSKNATVEVAPVAGVREEEYAPMTEAEAAEMPMADLTSMTDADAPATAEEAGDSVESAPPADPFADRDIKEVGKRSVKAFMSDNPEVKPFFQAEARALLGELNSTVKGQRYYSREAFEMAGMEAAWSGNSRHTSPDLAYLLDTLKMSYAEIEKGLNAIIEDNGKENIAAAKRIEFVLDERLRNGYKDFTMGIDIPPDQGYINALNQMQATAAGRADFEGLMADADSHAPAEEDIAPTRADVAPAATPAPTVENPAAEQTSEAPKVIATIQERLDEKLRTVQTQLYSMRELRADSGDAFDVKIGQLQAEYNGLKNKTTKKANEILRRIENMRAKKASVDADYAKAINDLEAKVDKAAEAARKGESPEAQGAMRRELHESKVEEIRTAVADGGYDLDEVLGNAKDLSTFATVDNTPERVNEKAFGYKVGQIINRLTIDSIRKHTTEGTKWLQGITDRKSGMLAQLSKQYGIKPGSKESAAAQMYAEGYFVDGNGAKVAYGDRELALDFPSRTVQANIKGLAKDPRIRQFYDETLARINESRVRNAYPAIKPLENYFFHFRAQTDTFSRMGLPFNPNDIRAKDLPTDMNGSTADLKPGQPYFASAKHRRGFDTTFDLLGGLERYAKSAMPQMYYIDDIQTLRALRNYIADKFGQAHGLEGLDTMTDEEVEAQIEKVYGSHLSTYARFLTEEANVVAGKTAMTDRALEGIFGRRGMTFIDTLNRQVGANMVGFNVSSSLTNFIAPVQAFAKTNKAAFVKGFAQTVASRIGSIGGRTDSFIENNPTMIRRKGADNFYRTGWQKAADWGYLMMGAVDSISTEIIVRSKYNELVSKGVSHEQAVEMADKWTSRLMGDRSLGQMPQLYNSKMFGLITKFQLEVRNQMDSQFYDTIQEAKVSAEDIQNKQARNAKVAAQVTSTFVQLAVAQHLFGKVFESIAGYNPAFDIIEAIIKAFGWDDEEESEDTVLDNLGQGLMSIAEDMPYFSVIKDSGRIPIASALPIGQLIKGEDKYGNEKSRLETIGETLPYYLLPGGYGQIKKTKQGLAMFDDDLPIAGSYTDSGNLRFTVEDNFASRAQAAVFGQWASSGAREYFDNEYAPLKENQIQEMIDADLPIREYREYREGLKGLDTLGEKVAYIADLDLPMSTKNLLVNNIADRKDPIDLTDFDEYSDWGEFEYAHKYPKKYDFLTANGISVAQYEAFDDDAKEAWSWAYQNPDKFTLSKSITDDLLVYRQYTAALNDITADKDAEGKSINGSRKAKVVAYLNELDADYYAKLILFKMEYNADDTYNREIIEYLNNRADISFEEEVTILKELGFTVTADGIVRW